MNLWKVGLHSLCDEAYCIAIVAAHNEGEAHSMALTVDASLKDSKWCGRMVAEKIGDASPQMCTGVVLANFHPASASDSLPCDLSLKMHLWELLPRNGSTGWDTYVSAVVAAETSDEAEKLWPGSSNDEVYSMCLGRAAIDKRSGLILGNYRAG
jgi:hypothetical protein